MKFQEMCKNWTHENVEKELNFNGVTIKVLQTIPIRDRYDLINITLQKALEGGVYNQMLIDIYFNLNCIYLYADIEFSEEDRIDEMELYDKLMQSGFIKAFLSMVPEVEYNETWEWLQEMIKTKMKYNNSIAGVVTTFLTEMPEQMAEAAKIVEQFNPEQYAKVVEFARAANGGRDIITNKDIETSPITV